jgi:hypothetical protein
MILFAYVLNNDSQSKIFGSIPQGFYVLTDWLASYWMNFADRRDGE